MDPGSSNQDEVGDYDEIDTWFGPMMNEEQQYVMDMEAINSSYPLMPLLQGAHSAPAEFDQPSASHNTEASIADISGTAVSATAHTDTTSFGGAEGVLADENMDNTEWDIKPPKAPDNTMKFESFEEAHAYYQNYARWHGFAIRIEYKREVAAGYISRGKLVCYKAGVNKARKVDSEKPESVVPQRNRPVTVRTKCHAMCKIKREGAWYVVEKFVEEHNHQVLRKFDLSRFMRQHRFMCKDEREFVKILHECNLPTSRMMQIMAKLHGKLSDVPYTNKDMANERAAFRHEFRVNDIQDTLAFFREMQAADPDFFYDLDLDDENRVQNLFWVDGNARRSYKYYNDFISFDTTFCTNEYKMPCAPFIGINNHGQSVQFGCGFIGNEDTLGFTWLFKTFLKCYNNVAPRNIITDQDIAMRAAIDEVFKDSVHRNCRWHIMQHLEKELGVFMHENPGVLAMFEDCINNSLSPTEFERKWAFMIEAYGLQDNDDLKKVYENRTCWVPAYFMKDFFPFLQSTQRSEGFNAVLKKYVDPYNSLYDFAQQYAAIQDKIFGAERQAEAELALKEPKEYGFSPLEKQLRKVYTTRIYNKFQEEMKLVSSYHCQQTALDKFEVSSLTGESGRYGDRTYEVTANVVEGTYSCECCKFERDGMLCCHIISTMQHKRITQVPSRYILQRWTFNADESLCAHGTQEMMAPAKEMSRESKDQMRYVTMSTGLNAIAKDASRDIDYTRLVDRHMKEIRREWTALKKRKEEAAKQKQNVTAPVTTAPHPIHVPRNRSPTSQQVPSGSVPSASDNVSAASSSFAEAHNPAMSKPKGRNQKRRYESPLDIQPRQGRKKRCTICKEEGHVAKECQAKFAHKSTSA